MNDVYTVVWSQPLLDLFEGLEDFTYEVEQNKKAGFTCVGGISFYGTRAFQAMKKVSQVC